MNNESDELKLKFDDLKYNLSEYITKKNLYDIIPSPKNIRYRNNIIFSIGLNNEGDIEVGPYVSEKNKIVEAVENNILVSELAVKICTYIKKWIIEYSVLPITKYPSFSGFWRHIQIKQNNKNEFIIGFRFGDMYLYENVWKKEKYCLINYLITRKEMLRNKYKLIGIKYQLCFGRKEPLNSEPFYEIYQSKELIQEILDKKFIINMSCFFQVNMYCSEIIYKIVKSLIKKGNILYDLCCGIGMYSIILSKYFNMIYGIDNNLNNIKIGEKNLELNNISNVKLICGKVEEEIYKINYILKDKKTLIINPPRRGIYQDVIDTINKHIDSIEQIIYVSCSSETLNRDLKKLLLKKKKIKNIIPLNQFPNTEHYEIIVNIC